jgi:hypothetical protein
MKGVQVHIQLVWHHLREKGVRPFIQWKRPDLKPNHVYDWLIFAQKYIHMTFSNECIFSHVRSFHRKYYYSNHEHIYLSPYQVQSMLQAKGRKIMVWKCITFFGPGNLSWITVILNSDLYLDILLQYILSSFNWHSMDLTISIF